MAWTRETAIATTSGTAHDFTGLPAGLDVIKLLFDQVSLSGTDQVLVQLGDAGGFETADYESASLGLNTSGGSNGSTDSTGFVVNARQDAHVLDGEFMLARITGNVWVASHVIRAAGAFMIMGGGRKELSAELTQVRVTVTGADTFDGGQLGCLHQ